MERVQLFLVLLFTFAAIIPSMMAHIGHFDDVWQKRAKEARKHSDNAYNPQPHTMMSDFNKHVHDTLKHHGQEHGDKGHHYDSKNSTRRHLARTRYIGPCKATNPIDRCWRCDPNWADNRKRLADCAMGFGHNTIGGKNGRFYTVTDSSDDNLLDPKPGTLRHAVTQNEPLWIIFAGDMTIRLQQELIMTSHKTIDGRGNRIVIQGGAQISMQFVRNIIITNIQIFDIVPGWGGIIRDSAEHVGIRTKSDGDGISIFGASDIWIDHVSMRNCSDGIIDVIEGSTAITISNSHFTDHNEVMLFGASDSYSDDQKLQITVAFNHFGKRLVQRMPRVRWGFVHVVNNDYTHWNMYAIGGSSKPTIISQGNRYTAPNHIFMKQVTKRDYAEPSEWEQWTWRSENDHMQNDAFFVESGNPNWRQEYENSDLTLIPPADGKKVNVLTRFAGVLSCRAGRLC